MAEAERIVDPGDRRVPKALGAFRTISEVASDLNVPQHVLRFWETRFSQIRPLKRAGGRRYYRPEDIELLRRIRELLYRHGYTIKGAQKLLREAPRAEMPRADPPLPEPPSEARIANGAAKAEPPPSEDAITAVLRELTELRDLIARRQGRRAAR